MFQTCNLLGKYLPTAQGSSSLVFEVPEVVTHMDGREPKSGALGKGWKLAGQESGTDELRTHWRTEINQDPMNNDFPHYSLSSPKQVSPLHRGESWFSFSSPAASLKFLSFLCFTAFLLLSLMLVSSDATWSCFPPSLGLLVFTEVTSLLPHLGVWAQHDLQELSVPNLGRVFCKCNHSNL